MFWLKGCRTDRIKGLVALGPLHKGFESFSGFLSLWFRVAFT